jgi:subtilisin family serine protease
MTRSRMGALTSLLLVLTLLIPGSAVAHRGELPIVTLPPTTGPGAVVEPDHVIVRWRAGTSVAQQRAVLAADGLSRLRDLGLPGLELAATHGQRPADVAARLAARPQVAYAEPDYLLTTTADPTAEDYFPLEWGLQNTGQSVNGTAGTAGTDISFLDASAVTLGKSGVVVAVLDDGVDLSHPDLADRAWVNPGESGGGRETNGIDDDGNGYVDDVSGWDFVHDDNTVHDLNQDFHGTHVAGTIAASINGVGIVGVAPQVSIMALKFIGPKGGSTSDAILAINYAAANGADVMNASWGGPDFSQALEDAIAASGLLMVAASGNDGADIDGGTDHSYPASFTLDNIISVGAVDQDGQLAPFSDYGSTSVDLVAPGVNILSDYPESRLAYADGTSMAAPHVTGAAALAISERRWLASKPSTLRSRLIRTGTDAPATHGLTVSGRMVNAFWALDFSKPLVDAPVARLVASWALKSGDVPVRITWVGSDTGSGLDRYQLQKQVDGGAWKTVSLAGPLTASILQRLPPAHTYRFRVRAWDQARNWSAWATGPSLQLVLRNEASSSISVTGAWTRPWVTSAIGGRLRRSDDSGATASMPFTGRSIAWIAERGPGHGKAEVYINGSLVTIIDLEAATVQPRRVVFARTWSTSSQRTIEIRVLGTAGRPLVTLDAFAFLK